MKRKPNTPRFLPRRTPAYAYAYASGPASHAPVGYQFGFVFESGPEDRLIKTAAHEPGHGRFQLRQCLAPGFEISKAALAPSQNFS